MGVTRLAVGDNPLFAGQEPRLLTAACHDRSPFLTIACPCGDDLHLHETQLDELPPTMDLIVTRCHNCGRFLELELGDVRAAFAAMRAAGWIK